MGIKASNQITLMNIDLAADIPEEMADLEARVTKAETNISQNKSEIELRATKTELNATNDTVSELAITAKGVDMTSEYGNGKLVSFIGNRNGSGVWESKYTVGSNVVSGLYFDFANSQFVFDGSIVGGSINIGNGTFKVSSSGALTATSATISGSISGSSISGGSISGTSISGGSISGTSISGGSININNRFKVDSSGNVTLPDNATISWSQVSSKPTNLATTSDIPSDSYITSITQNNVTTTYLNSLGIVAGSVKAENITGTTISGKTISGGTVSGSTISGGSINIGSGTFTVSSSGALTASSANITGVLKAGTGSSIGNFYVDENSIYSGSWGSTGATVFMCTGSGSYTIGGKYSSGWAFGAGGKFGVLKTGEMYSTGGRIGGWYIGDISATDASTSVYSGQALYSDSYTEGSDGYPTLKGATLRIAMTPQYLILYGTNASGDTVAIKRKWSKIIASTA